MVKETFIAIALLAISAHSSIAAIWYADSLATTGNGSLTNPWNLNIAFTNSAALNGNTLYLRGGNYTGRYRSTLTNATVRSYPGEWAVLNQGAVATVAYDANDSTNKIALTGSEWFASAQVVVFTTGEHAQLSSVANGTNWTVNRGWNGTTAKAQPAGTVAVLQDPAINHTGTGCVFRDFEITSLLSTNRDVGTNWWLGGGLNMVTGKSNKAINLVIHDTGHPGIGYWDQNGGQLYGNIMWGIGMYDFSPDYAGGVGVPRGSCVYSQNSGWMSTIENCIHFRNFTSGGKVYGETGPVMNFGFFTNISFNNGGPSIEGSSGSTSTSNLWFDGNITTGTPLLSYTSLSNRSTYFINNKVINGSFSLKETAYSVLTNNFVAMPKGVGAGESPMLYQSDYYPTNSLNITWDYNTYYIGDGSSISQWGFESQDWPATTNSAGGGILNFDNLGKGWTNWSGFDAHTTYAVNWPTDYQSVSIFPNDYDPNRWHIVIISMTGATNYALDLASLGFSAGQNYSVIKAEAWPTSTVGVYAGSGTINLPLNTTNITASSGTITHITDQSINTVSGMSNVFNAFVLMRESISTLGSMNISGNLIIGP